MDTITTVRIACPIVDRIVFCTYGNNNITFCKMRIVFSYIVSALPVKILVRADLFRSIYQIIGINYQVKMNDTITAIQYCFPTVCVISGFS